MSNESALHKFYTSRTWRDLSYMLKVQRGGRCERTGRVYSDFSQLIAHHKQELTEANIHIPEIALNPHNIEVISFIEHNKEHRRFGHAKRVFIVYGSPLSGKTSLVREMMRAGDIVVDIDALWEAVTFLPPGVKPNNCRFNIFALRDNLLDQIKIRYGQWCDAWVIGGYPNKYEREKLAEKLGAEMIYCEATRAECMERLAMSGRPESWAQYIDIWWERFNG